MLIGAFSAIILTVGAKGPRNNSNDKTQEATAKNSESNIKGDPEFIKAVEKALKTVEKQSPQVHQDSLRIWKNFKQAKHVHFTYRFWGRRIIECLKDEGMAFRTESEVGEVFKVLWRKGLISENAVVVLMVDAWSHLVYLEGSPSWEKRMENRSPEGGNAPLTGGRSASKERAV